MAGALELLGRRDKAPWRYTTRGSKLYKRWKVVLLVSIEATPSSLFQRSCKGHGSLSPRETHVERQYESRDIRVFGIVVACPLLQGYLHDDELATLLQMILGNEGL